MLKFKHATNWLRIFTYQSCQNQSPMKRDVFQAIADPTRRAILMLLAAQAMTPNTVAEHFDLTRQGVSKHLKVLSKCDLLVQKKSGREVYYHLNANSIGEIDRWLSAFRKQLEQRFGQLDEVLINLNQKK